MWWAGLGAILSHWRMHPLQLAMLLVGLSLATALWSGIQAINAEARASYGEAAAMLGRDQLESLVPRAGGRFDEETYIQLRRAGWQVTPVLEARGRIGDERLTIMGVDPVTAPPQAGLADLDDGAGLGPFLTPPGQGFAAPETAQRLRQADFPVLATDDIAPGTVVVDIGVAQGLLDAHGELSYLLIAPQQPAGLPALDEVAPQLDRVAPRAEGDLAQLTDSFHLNLTAFGFLAFAVGLFIVHSAVGLAFEQRRTMFRTLRALGLSGRSLMGMVLCELLGLALIAGLVGVALGYVIAAALLPDVAATLGGLYGADLAGGLTLRPQWWASGLGIALAGTLLAAARDLWRTARLSVVAQAQPRAWAMMSEGALALLLTVAVLLALIAAVLARTGGGLIVGFAMLGALLLSAALTLPVVLFGLLRLGQWLSRGILAQWFWADTRQQLPGLSLALMALLLALAANIGVGTMVSSFRATFTGWLDQRLVAELYVSARTEQEGAQLRAFLDNRADAVLPIRHVETRLRGQPGRIYGVADHATYRDHWPLLRAEADVWTRVARGEALLVNEQLARAETLWPGAELALPGGPTLPVAGVYSDYGNPQPQVMIADGLFDRLYPDAPRRQHAVRTDRPEALAAALQDRFGLPPPNVTNQAEAKAASLRIFERTFTVTTALNVLTLGVAGIALLTSMITLSGMRLPQLAPVWAMGVTRRRLAWLELARTVLLAAFTALAAVPVGLLLAWMLLAVINVEAFGWRLPLHHFPGDWLRLGLLALLTAVVAAAIPAWRLARMAPARLVQVFAHER